MGNYLWGKLMWYEIYYKYLYIIEKAKVKIDLYENNGTFCLIQ